jgi:uncharacterized integral membrane protein
MQVVIFLILLVCLSIFWLQNPQNIVITFLGTPSPWQMSLATWMLIFAVGGAMTSFLIQLLAKGRSTTKSNRQKQRPKKQETSSRDFKELDWENTEDSEWEIETPPKTPSIPLERPSEPLNSSPEIPPPTQPLPRQPSVYSYIPPQVSEPKQKEPKPKPETKDQDIYDANYRVITPPLTKPSKIEESQNENNEEDWI